MKKQKIAVFLSSLMMLSILVPAIVSAQTDTGAQAGTVKIEGSSDLFYEGYNPTTGTSNPQTLQFTPTPAKSTDQMVRISDEHASSPKDVTYGNWKNKQFIGVIHFNEEETFKINASSDGKFYMGTDLKFTTNGLDIVTGTGITETETGTDKININCEENSGCLNYELTATTIPETPGDNDPKTINQIYYYVPDNSNYTYDANSFTAQYNVSQTQDIDSEAYESILGAGQDILESTAGAQGVFGTGVEYRLTIPGNTPQGTYSTTITYDLTTNVIIP